VRTAVRGRVCESALTHRFSLRGVVLA